MGDRALGTFKSWGEAQAHLAQLAGSLPPEAPQKTDLRVTWLNAMQPPAIVYETTVDLEHDDVPELAEHVRFVVGCNGGRTVPGSTDAEEWAAYLEESFTAEQRAAWARIYDACEFP